MYACDTVDTGHAIRHGAPSGRHVSPGRWVCVLLTGQGGRRTRTVRVRVHHARVRERVSPCPRFTPICR
eukprot:5522984-Prymnesium_polylepis.1